MTRTFALALAVGLFNGCSRADPQPFSPATALDNWEYHWGASLDIQSDISRWSNLDHAGDWKHLGRWGRWTDRQSHRELWLRTRLPRQLFDRPALFFERLPAGLEVFVDGKLIFTAGVFENPQGFWFRDSGKHRLVTLSPEMAGKTLLLRTWDRRGLNVSLSRPTLGPPEELVLAHFRANTAYGMLGILFLFGGLTCLILAAFLSQRKSWLFLGLLAICFGWISLDRIGVFSLTFDWPYVRTIGTQLSMLSFGIWLTGSLAELIAAPDLAAWMRRLSYAHVAGFVAAALLDLFGLVHPEEMLLYGLPFQLISILACGVILAAAWRRGIRGASTLLIGAVPLGISIVGGAVASLLYSQSNLSLALPVGLAFFLAALAVRLVRRTFDAFEAQVASTALTHSEARFRALTDNAADIVYLLDSAGRFLFASPSCLTATGIRQADLYGTTLFDRLHPDDLLEVRGRFQTLVDEPGATGILEYRHRHADGSWRIHEARATNRLSDFDVAGLVVNVRDVTQRRLDEQKLRESEARLRADISDRKAAEERQHLLEAEQAALVERFRLILTHMPIGCIVADEQLQCTFWNQSAERIFGYRFEEIVGKQPYEAVISPALKPTVDEAMQRLASGETVQRTIENLTKDGRTIWCEWQAIPLRDSSGKFVGLLAMCQDVTARQTLDARVRQSQKLESLGLLAGGIAHDFNNLLVGILGHTGAAVAEFPADSPLRNNLVHVETAAMHAADLCKQLLAYAGKGKLVVQPVDLSEIVSGMAQLLEMSNLQHANLKLDLAKQLPAIDADPSQMKQVVMNLIINAADAIGDKHGQITVITGTTACDRSYLGETHLDDSLPAGTYVFVEVADTGGGMSDEVRRRIFDPFFSTKSSGRGLGLAVVLGIVRSHRGAIKVISEPGRGSAFRVLFPVSASDSVARAPSAEDSGDWRGSGLVLVADDDETVRFVAQRFFEKAGFTVSTAECGQQLIDLFRSCAQEVCLVMLDMTMPGVTHEETIRELRRLQPDVRILVSTGHSAEEAGERFETPAFTGFIQKPWRSRELMAKVRALLE